MSPPANQPLRQRRRVVTVINGQQVEPIVLEPGEDIEVRAVDQIGPGAVHTLHVEWSEK